MTESRSTDKLMALTLVMNKMLDKLPDDKTDKIKSIKITWLTVDDNGFKLDHALPELSMGFHK